MRQRDDIISSLTFEYQCRTNREGANGEGSSQDLLSWYAPDTLAQLRYLWLLIEAGDPTIRPVLTAVFSDLLFTCASTSGGQTSTGRRRRHHWGWIADNVRPKTPVEHNAIALFRQKLAAIEVQAQADIGAAAAIIQQDARLLALGDGCMDLVVTSPPYLGMIDYTHANRLLYTWMGWSMESDRMAEIGARFRRSRTLAADEYYEAMGRAGSEIFRVLRTGGFCSIVLGASAKFPQAVSQTLAVFEGHMKRVWGPVVRKPSRRRVSGRVPASTLEHICVFQKQ